ncbi:MAG: matrixin family metalloprotease [Cyanobacteriota bacterium]
MFNNIVKTLLYLTIISILFIVFPVKIFANKDFYSGKSAFDSGNYSSALTYLLNAIKTSPNNVTIRYYLAQTYYKTNKYKEAESEFLKIYQTSPATTEGKYSKIALDQLRSIQNKSINNSSKANMLSNNISKVSESNSVSTGNINYIKEAAFNGQIMRWQTSNMPLKVYIETNPKRIQNFNAVFNDYVKTGIEMWSEVTGNKINFKYVNSPNIADIKVFWITNFIDADLAFKQKMSPLGKTSPDYRDNELYNMEMRLVTTDPHGKTLDKEEMQAVACHEMGHALGIFGHSPDPKDIMYWSSSSVLKPSPGDISTMNLLYSI